MKNLTLTLFLALLAFTGWSQQHDSGPGQTPYPYTLDNNVFLMAAKVWGPAPSHMFTYELLGPTTLVSTADGSAMLYPCDCNVLTNINANIAQNNPGSTVRFTATLPDWSTNMPVYVAMGMTSCSNEPAGHTAIFSLRAAAIPVGGDITSPTFGPAQLVTNSVASAHLMSQSFFAPITVGNTGGAGLGSLVVFELTRGGSGDNFANVAVIGSLTVFFSRQIW